MVETPKTLFLRRKGLGDKLATFTQDPEMQEAFNMVLAQMSLNGPYVTDVGTSAAAHWELSGARKFINVLCSFHEATPAVHPTPNHSLNFDA